MRFEHEVPGIEQMYFRIGDVAPVSRGSRGNEGWIIFAPHGEKRRPGAAEVLLEYGILLQILAVVVNEVELNLIGAGARQIGAIERIAIG